MGWGSVTQLAREPFLDACANTPDQVADHAIDSLIDLYKFIDYLIHCIFGFASVDPCICKKDDDQEHDENNDQDCF